MLTFLIFYVTNFQYGTWTLGPRLLDQNKVLRILWSNQNQWYFASQTEVWSLRYHQFWKLWGWNWAFDLWSFWLCDYRGFQFEGSVKRWMNQSKPLIMNDLEWFKNPQNFEAVSMVNLKLTLTLMILLQNEENITVGNPQNYWGLTWSYFIWHHTLFYILYNPLFLSLIVYSSRSCISLTGCTCNLLRLTIVIYYW